MRLLLIALTVVGLATPAAAQVAPISVPPFTGGVPAGTATSEPLPLSLSEAIARALEHNLGALLADDAMKAAGGARWRSLSELLPNLNASVSETRQKLNLATFGISVPGVPSLVGPFNVFDARAFATQSVFDLKRIDNARADSHRLTAATLSYMDARDLVVLTAANGYLQVLAATARAESAKAQLDTAQALFNQAVDQRNSGLAAGIDVVRAEVQLSTERQRATATANDLEKTKLQLARAIGLPTRQRFAKRGLARQLRGARVLQRGEVVRPGPKCAVECGIERHVRARLIRQLVDEREALASRQPNRARELQLRLFEIVRGCGRTLPLGAELDLGAYDVDAGREPAAPLIDGLIEKRLGGVELCFCRFGSCGRR